MWNKCLKIAEKAHSGQERWNGDSYITHPLRVANRFENIDLKCIAILHDVIEDSKHTSCSLRFEGIPHNIVGEVEILSKKNNENYLDFILRIKESKIATQIKIEDIKDNLRDAKAGSMKDKYLLALYILELRD